MIFFERENKKTVLFVSGMFAGKWMWRNIDQRVGAGKTLMIEQALSEYCGSVQILSKQISKKLKDTDGPVSIVGNSLGGYVALDVAKRNPAQIDRVLISGSAGFGEVNLGLKLKRDSSTFINDLVDMIFVDSSVIESADRDQIAKVFRENMRNVIGLIKESNRADASNIIADIKCPIYAVWGQNDRITPLENALPALTKCNVNVDSISNCGHSPMYEKSGDFTEWMNDCLAA